MAGTRRWRWQNVPVPEVHVALVAAGAILDLLWRRRITPARSVRLLGVPLIVVGVVWAAALDMSRSGRTRSANRRRLDRPAAETDGTPAMSW